MASRDIQHLHPDLAKAYTGAAEKFSVLYPHLPQPFLTATYRSNEEQESLYAQGRTKPGPKVTNARKSQSAHNYNPSFAFDIAFKIGNRIDWSDHLFEKFALIILQDGCGITWGGNFQKLRDLPHFEKTGWVKLKGKPIAVKQPTAPKETVRTVYSLEKPYIADIKVKHIQAALGVKQDGVFGPDTEWAVKEFQKRHGLKPDGIVGPVTAKKLNVTI